MKLINRINNDKMALLGMFGLMAYNAFPYIGTVQSNDPASVLEEGSEGNISQPIKLSYIEKGKRLLEANDYAAVKTLYKLQSIFDDLAVLPAVDYAVSANKAVNMRDVVDSIAPFLSSGKLDTVKGVLNNVDDVKKTVKQITDIKSHISSLPAETPKGERLKMVMNELPSISGIPVLEKFNEIKSMMSFIKPLTQANGNNIKEDETEDDSLTDADDGDFDDIMEVVKLIEDKKK